MAARRATIDTSNLARMVESPAVGVDSTLSAGKLSHMLGDGMDISEHPQRRRETIDCSGLGTLQGLMDEVADEEPPAAAAGYHNAAGTKARVKLPDGWSAVRTKHTRLQSFCRPLI